jgi:hypothetical protein
MPVGSLSSCQDGAAKHPTITCRLWWRGSATTNCRLPELSSCSSSLCVARHRISPSENLTFTAWIESRPLNRHRR